MAIVVYHANNKCQVRDNITIKMLVYTSRCMEISCDESSYKPLVNHNNVESSICVNWYGTPILISIS